MDPILSQRRFGSGAARLPIGRPGPASALAAAARRPAHREGLIVTTAPLLMGLVAVLLGLASGLASAPDAPRDAAALARSVPPTWIEMEPWPTPLPAEPPVTPEAPSLDEPSEPSVAGATAAPPVEAPSPPSSSPAAEPRPFDLHALVASRTPTIPELGPSPAPTDAGRTTRPRPAGLPTAASITDRALALPRSSTTTPSTLTHTPGPIASPTDDPRRDALTSADDSGPRHAWTAGADRNAFLASLAEDADGVRGAGRIAEPLPEVAAATASREAEDRVRRAWAAEGWQEVPLDELPDCSPPGRQDALKRRILSLAPSGSSCRGAAGEYRFLEMRNLNAFLMWSRTNPTGRSDAAPIRDVCDVLDRAIRCLRGPVTKELVPR